METPEPQHWRVEHTDGGLVLAQIHDWLVQRTKDGLVLAECTVRATSAPAALAHRNNELHAALMRRRGRTLGWVARQYHAFQFDTAVHSDSCIGCKEPLVPISDLFRRT